MKYLNPPANIDHIIVKNSHPQADKFCLFDITNKQKN